MGVGADAGATKGVLGYTRTAGDSERGGMADGSTRVPEVLAPAELKSFLAGVVGPEPFRQEAGLVRANGRSSGTQRLAGTRAYSLHAQGQR